MRKLKKEEIESIINNEREERQKEDFLTPTEIDEYLEIVREEIMTWTYNTYILYWKNFM